VQQAFADDVRQEFSAPWAALFGRQHPLPTFFVNNTVTALVDYLCKVLRLALREAFSFSAQNLNIYLETSMSTTRSKDRAGLCSFTFANGHRCRSLRSTSHPHLCYYHARKESQARAAEQIGRDISYYFSGRYLWRTKTQNRRHSRLPRPDLAPDHPPRPGRIHQRFRHRLLAACRLFLRQRQLQIPHATRAPAFSRWPTTPSVFTACPNSATTSVRPCPATASNPTTQLGLRSFDS